MRMSEETKVEIGRWEGGGAQDLVGGAVLIAVALVALWSSRDLPGMNGFAFGPATAPTLVAGFLLCCGVAIVGSGILWPASRPRYSIRGPLFILLAIGAFASLVQPLGLMLSSYVTFIVASCGSRDVKWMETIVGGAVIVVCCSLFFSYALNMPFNLFPAAWR